MPTTPPRRGMKTRGGTRSARPSPAPARDELLFAAAHELRTPLTSVHGFARLLLTQLDSGARVEPDKLRDAIEAIEQQSQRLCRLVGGLLDAALLSSGRMVLEPRSTDLARLAEGVISLARGRSPEREMVLDVPAPVQADVDPIRLEQVLTNLVDNALKYSPAGARVTVSVRSGEDQVRLTVADEGPGVPRRHRAHIFDRFYRVNPETGPSGLGLGLHLCRQIVALHGGQLTAEFPKARGTRMVVRLPSSPRTAPTPRNPAVATAGRKVFRR